MLASAMEQNSRRIAAGVANSLSKAGENIWKMGNNAGTDIVAKAIAELIKPN